MWIYFIMIIFPLLKLIQVHSNTENEITCIIWILFYVLDSGNVYYIILYVIVNAETSFVISDKYKVH